MVALMKTIGLYPTFMEPTAQERRPSNAIVNHFQPFQSLKSIAVVFLDLSHVSQIFFFLSFFGKKLSLCMCAICPVCHITDLFILQYES